MNADGSDNRACPDFCVRVDTGERVPIAILMFGNLEMRAPESL